MTREDWLNAALHGPIAELLAQAGTSVPADCRVSVGFPGGGSARKRIGECWPRARSADKVNEIFISPVLADKFKMLEVLVHEAVHASDDCKSGHKGHFARVARACDLQGKLTATHAGAGLSAMIRAWIETLPAMSHGALMLGGVKKQSTRMLKHECNDCGAIWRASARWEMVCCPCCGGTDISS